MITYHFVKSILGTKTHFDFENLPKQLYKISSPRFKLGNDPVMLHLEGCYLLYQNNKPVGRFALYENPYLNYKKYQSATIGSYECIDDTEVSKILLNHAKKLIKNKGYNYLIGPMEGSTWNNYRFSDNNDTPNFFMEPYHHTYYNKQFIASGFNKIESYLSNKDELLITNRDKINTIEQQYITQGAVIRPLNIDDLNNELTKIAQLSLDGFADNFLYSPISIKDFVLKYEQYKSILDPQFIWLIEDKDNVLQAFIFCINDYNDQRNKTLIIKSLVRNKTSQFKGSGEFLTEKIIQFAHKKGYTKIIHALMINNNTSLKISKKHTGDQYKTYSLYGTEL